MTPNFSRILHGGDYNPDLWPETVWPEDMRLMKLAHVNVATLPVFGWAALQPDEDTFTFEWLDRILDQMHESGVGACLATATASLPAWVNQKYPDTLVTENTGVQRHHGHRHLFCPHSPNFRRLSTGLVRRIAERYASHPSLLLWHVGNEYGRYCYCNLCAAAFRSWLQERYGSLEELNRRWYTGFWGHTFTDWEQIEPPYKNGHTSIQALAIDYHRFQSNSLLDCYRAEAAILREVTPDVPITTNMMGPFMPLDYREWAKELDVVSWDCYPRPDDPPANVAFSHALMRGLKEGQPFLLMEQSPSQQNWQPYNWLKPPGTLRLQSFQAMAQGADAIMYFQWRRSRAGIEKLHGAVVEHGGDETNRVFREVAALGAELEKLGNHTLGGRVPSKVAILWSWEAWWSLQLSSGPSQDLDYPEECRRFFTALYQLGIGCEIMAPDADLSPFDLILAPVLTMLRPEHAAQIEARVQSGATLLASYFSGLVDENDMVYLEGAPGPLRKVLGLRVEETDALPPPKQNGMVFEREIAGWKPTKTPSTDLLCDRLRLEGAEVIARYSNDFYAGEPVLTVNSFGAGRAYYLASRPNEATLRDLVGVLCLEQGIISPLQAGEAPPVGVEVSVRVSPDGRELLYLLNHNLESVSVSLQSGQYIDLLTYESLLNQTMLAPCGVKILAKKDA